MERSFTTVATFHQAAQAELALNVLTEAGIDAVVADAEIVAMDWLLANAVGGIKVQVRLEDAERAAALLDGKLGGEAGLASEDLDEEELARQALAASPEEGHEDEEADEEPEEEKEVDVAAAESVTEPVPERTAYARRLLFAAMLGLLFPPIIFYAFYLLLNALFGDGTLSRSGWLDLIFGGAITMLVLVCWFFLIHLMM